MADGAYFSPLLVEVCAEMSATKTETLPVSAFACKGRAPTKAISLYQYIQIGLVKKYRILKLVYAGVALRY